MSQIFRFYPILDDSGKVRAISFVYKGETLKGYKQGLEVTQAVSLHISEQVDLPQLSRTQSKQKRAVVAGTFLIRNTKGRALATVNSFKGLEEECKTLAERVAARLSKFYKEKYTAEPLTEKLASQFLEKPNEKLSIDDQTRMNPGFPVGGYYVTYISKDKESRARTKTFPAVPDHESAFYKARQFAREVIDSKLHVEGTLVWQPWGKDQIKSND